MTLTLELTPEVETRLHELAARHGQTEEEYALQALHEKSQAEQREFEEAVAGIRRGMADAEAGREISLEDYRAAIAQEQMQAHGRQQAAPREAA
jgi:predicted transcriptional regulator